jgi:hypothetical protein
MEFEIIQGSVWTIALMVAVWVATYVLVLGLIRNSLSVASLVILLSVIILGTVGSAMLSFQNREKNDASFSKQLMDVYGAKSNRPFSDIKDDLTRHDETNAVFTQEGKETTVSIKLVNRDDKKIMLGFTVDDNKPFYPKPVK